MPDPATASETEGALPAALLNRLKEVLALERAGKPDDAFAKACAVAVKHHGHLETVRLAVDLAQRIGKRNGPTVLAKGLRANSTGKHAAAFALCYAQFRRNRFDAAAKAATELAGQFPEHLETALLLAEIKRAQSDFKEAIDALRPMVDRHPASARLHHKLASLYLQDDKPDEAVDFAERARQLGLTSAANAHVLGSALTRTQRHADAIAILEEADAAEPGNLKTIAYLSLARCSADDLEGAMADVERALALKPLSVHGPKDGQVANLTTLVVECCDPYFFNRPDFTTYNINNFPGYTAASDLRMIYAPLTRQAPSHLRQTGLNPNIVLNNIAVSELVDERMNECYQALIEPYERSHIPVVNPLESVLLCGREDNSRKFANETGFIFPRTNRIAPLTTSFDQVLAEIEADYTWPIIVRPTQTNVGAGMRLIDGPDALRQMFDDKRLPDYYAIQYYECRDDKGVGRQCRAVVIDGKAYLDRMISHRDFQSHDFLRHTSEWDESGFDRDEQALLADPDNYLGFAWKDVFTSIIEQTPLDIFGFDFALSPEGRPVVFEVNAAMNLFNPANVQSSPYLADHYRFLNDAVVRYLKERVENATGKS